MGVARRSLDEIAAAIRAAVPKLDAADQRIAVAVYRRLAGGRPVPPADVAAVAGVSPDRVEEALRSWPGVYRDRDGRVVGFWGLTIGPLDPEYRFTVDGRTLYTWCAWDNLFIPAILRATARVEAACPVTGEAVSVVATPEGVREVRPRGIVVSMVLPDEPFGFDVIQSFCHNVLFFASEDAGARWAAERDGAMLLSIEEAFELGRHHVSRLGPALRAD